MGKRGRAFTLAIKSDLPKLREIIRTKKITPHWIGKNPLQGNDTLQKEKPEKRKMHYRPSTVKKRKDGGADRR